MSQEFKKYIKECPICGSRDHSDGRCEWDGRSSIPDKYDEGR